MTSLKKNMAYNVAYQVLVIVLPLVTAPYVSRILGAEGLGIYSYIFSIVTYFGLFGMLGIANHGNRSIALTKADREKVSQTFINIYVIQLFTTFVALIAYLLFVTFLFSGNKIVAYIQTIILLSYVLDITWCFFGLEQFAVTVTRNAIIKIVTVIAIFTLVKHRDDVWIYAFIMSFGMLFSQLYLWFQLHKFVSFKKPQWANIKRNIQPILLLFVPAIAYSIYKLLDKVMLGAMTSMAQVGMFDNAEKIINIPTSLITAFGTVMMPRITTLLASSDSEKISYLNRISVRYFTILVVGAAFGLAGISSVLAPVYFGQEFADSSVLIAGLGFSLIFVTWANVIRTQYLIPQQLDRPYVISTLIGAVANLAVNLVLIPRFAAVGAMIGTIAAEFTVFFAQLLFVRRQFPMMRYIVPTLWLFPIGAVMCFAVFEIGHVMGTTITSLVVQFLVGGVIYLTGSALYLWLVRDEFLMRMLTRLGWKTVSGRHSQKFN